MKRTIFFMFFVGMTMMAGAQNTDSTDVVNDSTKTTELVSEKPDVMPQYPGGLEAMTSFISKNLKYPELAASYGVEGKVIMSFIVEKDGKLSNFNAVNCQIDRFNTSKFSQETEAKQNELKREFARLFAKDVVRVLRKMPKWTPGMVDGKNVRTKFALPVTFTIPDK